MYQQTDAPVGREGEREKREGEKERERERGREREEGGRNTIKVIIGVSLICFTQLFSYRTGTPLQIFPVVRRSPDETLPSDL